MLGFGGNLETMLIGFGMSAAFITFICARLVCSRARGRHDSAAAAFDQDDLDPGLHETTDRVERVVVAVAMIPTVKYNKEAFHSKEDAQCSICLRDYQEKDILRIMPSCGHNFHLPCIDTWLEHRWTCPICGLPLKDSFHASAEALGTHHPGTERLVVSIQQLQSHQEVQETISVVVESPQRDPESTR